MPNKCAGTGGAEALTAPSRLLEETHLSPRTAAVCFYQLPGSQEGKGICPWRNPWRKRCLTFSSSLEALLTESCGPGTQEPGCLASRSLQSRVGMRTTDQNLRDQPCTLLCHTSCMTVSCLPLCLSVLPCAWWLHCHRWAVLLWLLTAHDFTSLPSRHPPKLQTPTLQKSFLSPPHAPARGTHLQSGLAPRGLSLTTIYA